MTEYVAYHGTNSANVESIKKEGFNQSSSHNEWLGCGVYFFIGGSFCPISNAREWAKSEAWDKENKGYIYTNYSILKVCVSGERVLDLRAEADLKIFDKIRQHILDRYEKQKSSFKIKPTPDTFLCDSISKSMKLDILINNFYIKSKNQRIKKINSRFPNSTVLCAKETAIISLYDIKEVESEGVEHE